MGPKADEVLLSFHLTPEEEEDYALVLERFQGHFVVRKNRTYERAKFNSRIQANGESVEAFVTALHTLAEHCEFGALHDELICDRMVVGLSDKGLSERLQLDPQLSLDKAVTLARQSESVKSQQRSLHGCERGPNVDRVAARPTKSTLQQSRSHGGQKWQRRRDSQAPSQQQGTNTKCYWCGGDRHPKNDCPAREATCSKCKKVGHYARVCRSASQMVGQMEAAPTAFLGALSTETLNSSWTMTLLVRNSSIRFRLDTGADVTAASPRLLLRSVTRGILNPSNRAAVWCVQYNPNDTH